MRDKIKSFVKNYYLAIIFALIAGAVSVWPQISPILSLSEPYQGAPLMFTANEDIYMARIQEVIDGHWQVGSPLFYEYKNRSNIMMPIGEYFYAIPAIFFKTSLANIMIVSKFVLPAILFLLVYFFILRLSLKADSFGSKINATAGGLFVVLGYDLVDFRAGWLLLTGKMETFNLLIWTRPVNPIIGAILIFSFLLLVWNIYKDRKKYLFIPAGLILGLMIGYFFSWGLSLAVLAALLIISIWLKDYWFTKKIMLIAAVSLIFSAPLWFNLFFSIGSASGKTDALKYGMFFTHLPIINKLLLALTVAFMVISFIKMCGEENIRREDNKWWWFCLALIGGGWLAFNQQIITGRTIWPYHFVQYTIPLAIVIGMALMVNFIKPKFKYLWLIAVIFIFLSVAVYNISALKSYADFNDSFGRLQRKMPLFNYLNGYAPKDCVVLADSEENSLLIPALTHCNVYAASYVIDGVPEERIKHNYLVWLRFNSVKAEAVEDYLINHQGYLRAYFYENWGQLFAPIDDEWFKNLVKEISSAYKEFVKKDFSVELKKYRLDYVLSEKDLTDEKKKLLPNLKYINSFDGLALYRF